jgi:uncharacterized membrane protein YcaP (DUF421 family)
MGHAPPLLLIRIAVRTAVVLIYLTAGLRLLGKRQLGQMNIYDLAMVMALANAVQNAMTAGSGHLAAGVVSAGMLLLLGRLLTLAFARSPTLEQRLCGTPTILISDGHVIRDHLRRECVTLDEVMAVLRHHGLTHPSEVKLAVLEVDGTLSVVPRDDRSAAGQT